MRTRSMKWLAVYPSSLKREDLQAILKAVGASLVPAEPIVVADKFAITVNGPENLRELLTDHTILLYPDVSPETFNLVQATIAQSAVEVDEPTELYEEEAQDGESGTQSP